jgi:hypothetical protein
VELPQAPRRHIYARLHRGSPTQIPTSQPRQSQRCPPMTGQNPRTGQPYNMPRPTTPLRHYRNPKSQRSNKLSAPCCTTQSLLIQPCWLPLAPLLQTNPKLPPPQHTLPSNYSTTPPRIPMQPFDTMPATWYSISTAMPPTYRQPRPAAEPVGTSS